jgi:hypothetical protein
MEKKVCLTSIGVLLVFAIVFTAVLPFLTPSKETENKTPSLTPSEETEIQNSLKETDRNSYYSYLASNLMGSFPKVSIQTEYGEKKVTAYPPEYGGTYIDKSNTLHILLTKNANMTTKTSYLEIMDNDEDIIFEIVDFPLSLLYEIQRSIDAETAEEFGIMSTCLNETGNRLDIGLLDITKENEVTEFFENKFNDFDSRCLTFKFSSGITITAAHTASNHGIIFTEKARASNTQPYIYTHI